jgi:predicted alpha/beta superfamily hydrolase
LLLEIEMSIWFRCLLVLIAVVGAGCGKAEDAPTPGIPPVPLATVKSSASAQVTVLSQQLTIPGLNRQRTVRIYLPPGYATSTTRYPVLYMHDGQNLFDNSTAYAGEWGVDETLDGLAKAQGLELIVVGIDNGGVQRMTELNAWNNARFGKGEGKPYMDFIVNVVKPMVDASYRTLPEREHTGVMGSSMGGLISHYAILQYPKVFSKAGIFSPAYWPGPEVFALTESQPPATDARLALYLGGDEGEQAVDDYQRMVLQLKKQSHPGANLWFKLTPAAQHNEGAWRSEFAQVVSWLFMPGK